MSRELGPCHQLRREWATVRRGESSGFGSPGGGTFECLRPPMSADHLFSTCFLAALIQCCHEGRMGFPVPNLLLAFPSTEFGKYGFQPLFPWKNMPRHCGPKFAVADSLLMRGVFQLLPLDPS